MCGISFIYSKNKIAANAPLNSLAAMHHRGPDDSRLVDIQNSTIFQTPISNQFTQNNFPKTLPENSSNAWLGFNRLAIVGLNDSGMQPFYCSDSNTWMVLNGEVYNYQKLINQFNLAPLLQSSSDAEVAFRLYLKLGEDFVNYLRGMFAILLFNANKNEILAWRDPLGIKPLYYFKDENKLIIASEINGILAYGIEKIPNYVGLAYGMYLETCPAPLTVYQNIFILPAGNKMRFEVHKNQLRIEYYWKLKYNENSGSIDLIEMQAELDSIAENSLAKEVRSAVLLSGGLDSGTLAFHLHKIDSAIEAIHLNNSIDSEQYYAALSADAIGLKMKIADENFILKNKTIEEWIAIEESPNSMIEPTALVSYYAQLEGYKVLYNALGPDELFGGYAYYQKAKWLQFFQYLPNNLFFLEKMVKAAEISKYGVEATGLVMRQQNSWANCIEWLKSTGHPAPIHPVEYILIQIRAIYPEFDSLPFLKQISYTDFFYYISSHHSLRSDLPSMKFSIEMRFPFLDIDWIQKYFNYNIFEGIGRQLKPIWNTYARQILPKEIFDMPKKGFRTNLAGINEGLKKKTFATMHYSRAIQTIFGKINQTNT